MRIWGAGLCFASVRAVTRDKKPVSVPLREEERNTLAMSWPDVAGARCLCPGTAAQRRAKGLGVRPCSAGAARRAIVMERQALQCDRIAAHFYARGVVRLLSARLVRRANGRRD